MRELGLFAPKGLRRRLPVNMVKNPLYGAPRSGGARALKRVAAPLALILLAASVMFPVATPAAAEEIEGLVRSSPHDFGASHYCAVCHQGEPPALNLDPMATCTKCHHGNMGNHPVSRHPLGMTPRMSVPAYLPLSKEGKMVCFTCHDPHNKSGIDKMLRVTFKKLCASCHAGY